MHAPTLAPRSPLAFPFPAPSLPAGGLGEDAAYFVPGLCLPKGLDALLPVYQRALMHGAPDARESAATGIGELVELTSPEALKPLYVKITGPLIRVMADKFPWGVKAAILRTLAIVIDSGGAALKPFQPQLQTTFVKALTDPTQAVRSRAAAALGRLMAISTRLDPLVNELAAGVAGTTGGIRESQLEALTAVFAGAGDKVTPPVRAKALETVEPLLGDAESDHVERCLAGAAVGAALRHAEPALAGEVLGRLAFAPGRDDDAGGSAVAVDPSKDGRCAAIKGALKHGAPGCAPHAPALAAHVTKAATNEHAAIRGWGARTAGYFLAATAPTAGDDATAAAYAAAAPPVLAALTKLMADPVADVRKAAIDGAKRYGKASPGHALTAGGCAALLPPLINIAARESGNMVLRTAADHALAYLSQVHAPSAGALAAACATVVPAADGAWLATYAPRMLKRLGSAHSDDDDEDAD